MSRWYLLRRRIANFVFPEGGRLQNEAYFLGERYVKPEVDDTGLSSDALLRFALYGTKPPEFNWPRDAGDFGRCQRMYDAAPPHLQRKMLPTLERFRDHVTKRGHSV